MAAYLELSTHARMPILGLGTSQSVQGAARDVVTFAIDAGYRHFDCAYTHQNESKIGEELRQKMEEGVVRREELFIVSKAGEELFPADGNSMIIHSDTDFLDTWEDMEELVDMGMVKAIGVSNFNRTQIHRLLGKPGLRHKPANHQIESHPYLPQEELISFASPKGSLSLRIVPLEHPTGLGKNALSKPDHISLFDDPQIKEIALKHKKTPAQVLIWLQIQRNVSVIPKSVTPQHIEENCKVFDFELTEEEMETLLGFKELYRICALSECKNHKDYPFFEV